MIPTGIDNDGMVCCDIQLQGGFDVPEDSFVDVPYSVKSEDLNVKGNAEGIIRVQDGGKTSSRGYLQLYGTTCMQFSTINSCMMLARASEAEIASYRHTKVPLFHTLLSLSSAGGCPDPFFENNTPMVTGDDVTIDLSDCVTEATCTFAGSTVDCKFT